MSACSRDTHKNKYSINISSIRNRERCREIEQKKSVGIYNNNIFWSNKIQPKWHMTHEMNDMIEEDI